MVPPIFIPENRGILAGEGMTVRYTKWWDRGGRRPAGISMFPEEKSVGRPTRLIMEKGNRRTYF
jgi:hypothetical protein